MWEIYEIIRPRDVCIAGVARTLMGGLLGSLSSIPATKLGSTAVACALERANVDPSLVQEVFFGKVLSTNLGQAPARQAALGADIPNSVVWTTIDKGTIRTCTLINLLVFAATMIAAQSIQTGVNDIVVAGGMESMSNAPKYLAQASIGSRLGHDTIIDGMLRDGLWDVYNDFTMGICGELCAKQHKITKEEQAISYAIACTCSLIGGHRSLTLSFSPSANTVQVSGGRGKPPTLFDKDEGLGKMDKKFPSIAFEPSKLKNLHPSFKENGTVTAGNVSIIRVFPSTVLVDSDGAAALVLVSGEEAFQLGLQVIAKIKGFADAAQVVALANQKLLGLDPVPRQRSGKYGVAAVCNGGGGAFALFLEHMYVL
ncbi:Thiolase, N-terminal [Dillenia turbinata]|uniref:Thiolase, N-terminal n=1 Tax=Dillenia turbinata TaxID=194707 RepID=A0AAN8WEW0_9MAGN